MFEKIQKIYDSLTESEKFGLGFGLFPIRIKSELTTREETVALMGVAKNNNYK
jgi:hypothetical protein